MRSARARDRALHGGILALAGPDHGPSPPLLLVLRALGLGDLLTGIPALRALADAFPHHRRVLAAPAALEPLALLSGAVDAVAPAEPLAPVQASLGRPDVAVNLHGRGPESHRILLATQPGTLIAFAHPDVPESGNAPRWRPDEHEVSRWCRLLQESGVPADPGRLGLEPPSVSLPEGARDATVVHPGAASAARRWPAERFAAVARSELQRGRRVLITGGAGEVQLARAVAAAAGVSAGDVLAGQTGLLELAGLVAAAGRVVCADTGVAHLATAFGTPSIVLFGPVSPAAWGPPANRPNHRVLWAGGHGDPHGTTTDPGLLRIGVDDVLAALAAVDRPAGAPSRTAA